MMTTPWESIDTTENGLNFKSWLEKTPISAEEYNGLDPLRRRELRSRFDLEQKSEVWLRERDNDYDEWSYPRSPVPTMLANAGVTEETWHQTFDAVVKYKEAINPLMKEYWKLEGYGSKRCRCSTWCPFLTPDGIADRFMFFPLCLMVAFFNVGVILVGGIWGGGIWSVVVALLGVVGVFVAILFNPDYKKLIAEANVHSREMQEFVKAQQDLHFNKLGVKAERYGYWIIGRRKKLGVPKPGVKFTLESIPKSSDATDTEIEIDVPAMPSSDIELVSDLVDESVGVETKKGYNLV